MSGNRLSDGSVPVTLKKFSIKEGQTTTVDLVIEIPDNKLSVIGEFDSETRYWKTAGSEPVSILSSTGRGVYVVGFLTPRHEPSVHAVNDIIASKDGLEKWGRPIMLLTSEEGLGWLKEYASRMPSNVQYGIAPKEMLEGTMPRVMIADTFNRVFFKTEGYTIGLGSRSWARWARCNPTSSPGLCSPRRLSRYSSGKRGIPHSPPSGIFQGYA